MKERHLRAAWFALFASMGLIIGGFVIGYGTALVGGPVSEPDPVSLPTLAAGPAAGTDVATDVERVRGRDASGSAVGTATPAMGVTDATANQPASSPGTFPQEQTVGAGLVVSLDGVDVDSSQGGVEVILRIDNRSDRGLAFSFSPATDLIVSDSLGRRYDLRWAEFQGAVRVGAREGARLARAYFTGPMDEGTQYLTVKVRHPPQLPEVSWLVPLSR